MKKCIRITAVIVLYIIVVSFTACSEKSNNRENDDISENESEKAGVEDITSEIMVSSKDDLFKLEMYMEKDTYRSGVPIDCYATLEYVGENNSITVYSSFPLLYFTIKDDTLFKEDSFVHDDLVTTTFTKGQTTKYDYSKSGSWSDDDPNADFYKKFYSEKELILPPGTYEITAVQSYSLNKDNIVDSEYMNTVSTFITVTE